jgi:hypothetical protein
MSYRLKHIYRFVALFTLVACAAGSEQLLAQKTPNRPPIDLNPPEEVPVTPARWSDGLSGALIGEWGFPVGAFHENEDGGGGVAAHVAYAIERTRVLSLRTNFGWVQYGNVSRTRRVPVYDEFGTPVDYQDEKYSLRNHSMLSLDAGPELTRVTGKWRPYGFATAGFSVFQSRQNLRAPVYAGDPGDDRTFFSHANFAWTTGLGLRVGSVDPRGGAFDFGVSFRRNQSARYANERALTTNPDGSFSFSTFSGSANLIAVHVGVWIGPRGVAPRRR